MTQKERYEKLIAYFEEALPTAQTELEYANAYQLLVAVILSAQCTDKRVNMVTPALFKAYPTVQDMAQATPDEIFSYIHSVSYPNNKSRHLAGMARKLVEDFGGEVPDDIDELQTLPGVGRKTANVIASVVFHLPAQQNPIADRERVGETHSRRETGHSTPLADTAWAVCVPGTQAPLCGMWHRGAVQHVQETVQDGGRMTMQLLCD